MKKILVIICIFFCISSARAADWLSIDYGISYLIENRNAKIVQVTQADPTILEYHLQDEKYLYLCFVYIEMNNEPKFDKSPIKPTKTYCYAETK